MDLSPSTASQGGTGSSLRNKRDLNELRFEILPAGEPRRIYRFTDLVLPDDQLSNIPVASDFAYDLFRTTLLQDLRIPLDATLYPPEDSGLVNIASKSSCLIALTQIQASETINLPNSRPTLRLTTNPVARPSTPPRDNKAKPAVVPSTPPNPNTNTPQGTATGPKTADSPGDLPDGDQPNNESDDESDDDYDDRTGNRNDIMKNFPFDWSRVDDRLWQEACDFFCCDIDAPFIRIEGIKVDIEPYQALAIYRALRQFPDEIEGSGRGHNSFIIGDDVGLGKTGMTLCIATILFLAHQMRHEVQEEWSAPPSTGLKHAPSDNPDRQPCPTQKGGILCYCQRRGFTYWLTEYLSDRPTVIVTPPGLIPTFVGEAAKWIDSSPNSPASPVTIHVAHSSYNKSEMFFDKAKASLMTVPRAQTGELLSPADGSSRHIVIMGPAGVKEFLSKFKVREPNVNLHALHVSLMFFDEFHTYRGDRTRLTIPFKMLTTIGLPQNPPLVAIGLSGSARADCAYWRPFIRYSLQANPRPLQTANSQVLTYDIAGMTKIEDFDKYENSWSSLVNNLNDTTLQGARLIARDERRDDLFNFLRAFIPVMMISRQRGDMFRGVEILARRNTELIRCDAPGTSTQYIFTLISQVESLIHKEYRIALNDWVKNGRKDEKPIKREFAHRRLEIISDRPRQTPSTVSQLLLRSSTFPAVAQLVYQGSIKYEALLGAGVISIATKVSNILAPNKISDETMTEALDVLKSSPWWEHRDLLYEQSSKIQEVERQIDTLIDISTKDVDDPSLADVGPPPSDGTAIRHLLLYADYPLSAFLMLMVLLPRYSDSNVVFMYAHSGVGVKTRQNYVDYIQRDCKAGDPVKILISTISIIGRGYNIFRASNVIITEIPRSSDLQNQAFGRVDRRGQVMEPRLIQLYDGINLLEEVRRIRNANRDQLSGTTNDTSLPLADLILNEGDDGKLEDDEIAKEQASNKQTGNSQGGSGQAGNKQDDSSDEEEHQQQYTMITKYFDDETEAAARAAFPDGRFRRIPTSGMYLLCGRNALVGSIHNQLADIRVDDPEDLLSAIYAVQGQFGYADYRNFSPDQLQAGLREWARRNDVNVDFRLGYIQHIRQDNEAVLSKPDTRPAVGPKVVLWVYLTTTGDDGHFEAVGRVV
ncbi:hypothetical protein F4859DRAFT_512397 [Xylaria cf. heliscus]|nr:hypothetical protein F4859DRAFT_512397 [Xylaria cf. heliscus]